MFYKPHPQFFPFFISIVLFSSALASAAVYDPSAICAYKADNGETRAFIQLSAPGGTNHEEVLNAILATCRQNIREEIVFAISGPPPQAPKGIGIYHFSLIVKTGSVKSVQQAVVENCFDRALDCISPREGLHCEEATFDKDGHWKETKSAAYDWRTGIWSMKN